MQASLWGLLAGSALVLGALVGYFVRVPKRVVGAIMAFGAGVLTSALAFELVGEARERGGLLPTALGFLAGAAVYACASWLLAHRGARHRKRSTEQPSEDDSGGSGMAIALGAALDGIPESIVVGLGMAGGGTVSLVTVAAIFLSNVPEGLSSAAGMRAAGRPVGYVFAVWGAIAVMSGLASLAGYVFFGGFSPAVIAATTGVAAGAILAMVADTMLPEAVHETREFTGLITALGFLTALMLSSLET
jgi:ZIP family zinc transporter